MARNEEYVSESAWQGCDTSRQLIANAKATAARPRLDVNTGVLIEVTGLAAASLAQLRQAAEGDRDLAAAYGLDSALCDRAETLAGDLGTVLGALHNR